jgi:hypothetical protein
MKPFAQPCRRFHVFKQHVIASPFFGTLLRAATPTLLVALVAAAVLVFDPTCTLGSLGGTVPEVTNASTSAGERKSNSVSALLASWEATAHCQPPPGPGSCANCANPGNDCSPIITELCGNTNPVTFYFPQCCSQDKNGNAINWDQAKCTWRNANNSCNPQCVNCCQ